MAEIKLGSRIDNKDIISDANPMYANGGGLEYSGLVGSALNEGVKVHILNPLKQNLKYTLPKKENTTNDITIINKSKLSVRCSSSDGDTWLLEGRNTYTFIWIEDGWLLMDNTKENSLYPEVVLPVDSTIEQIGKEIALTDDYLLLGAPTMTSLSSKWSGKGFIYDKHTREHLFSIDNPNPNNRAGYDFFGEVVAASKDYVVFGTAQETEADNIYAKIGMIAICDIHTGNVLHVITNPNTEPTRTDDSFAGGKIAMNNTYTAVGAYNEEHNGLNNNGVVYVFENATGALVQTIYNPDVRPGNSEDTFGKAIDMSDTHIVISADGEDDANTSSGYSGVVYVFDISDWSLIHTIENASENGGYKDRFGDNVNINDKYVAISASGEDVEESSSGTVYLFDLEYAILRHTFQNPDVNGTSLQEFFGEKVDMDNQYLVVAVRQEDNVNIAGAGVVYVFDLATMKLKHILANPNYTDSYGDSYATSVAIHNNTLAVGASGDRPRIDGVDLYGVVWLYEL